MNPSSCESECDKSWDIGEYLDYANCKCRKRIIDELVEQCIENINEKKLHSNEANYYEKICSSSFFSIWSFLLQPFTNHRTAEEGVRYFFNSSLPLPPA